MDPGMSREGDRQALSFRADVSCGTDPNTTAQRSCAPPLPALMVESVLMLQDGTVFLRLKNIPACTGWTWSH